MKKYLEKKEFEEENLSGDPQEMIDEDLEADALELDEWAFMKGYYGEEEG